MHAEAIHRHNQSSPSQSTRCNTPFFHKTANDAESVVQRPAGLSKHEFIRTLEQDADALLRRLAACHYDATTLAAHVSNVTKTLRRKRPDVRDGLAANSLADEWDIFTLDVLDDHDACNN